MYICVCHTASTVMLVEVQLFLFKEKGEEREKEEREGPYSWKVCTFIGH